MALTTLYHTEFSVLQAFIIFSFKQKKDLIGLYLLIILNNIIIYFSIYFLKYYTR